MIVLKLLGAALAVVLGLLLLTVAWGLVFGLPGKVPGALGVQENGRLSACRNTPNCVNSDASGGYAAIDALPLRGTPAESMARLRVVLEAMDGITVLQSDDAYLYAIASSRWLGFVDDLEFLGDSNNSLIRVKSASRLGRKDFEVNRKRVERIRAAYLAQA